VATNAMLLDKRLTFCGVNGWTRREAQFLSKHCWKKCQKKVTRLILKTQGIREILKNQPLSFSVSPQKRWLFFAR